VPDPVGSRQEQYATIEVADTGGSQIVVTWRGWSVDDATETEVISLEVTIGEAGGGTVDIGSHAVQVTHQTLLVEAVGGVSIQVTSHVIQVTHQALTVTSGAGTVNLDSHAVQVTHRALAVTGRPAGLIATAISSSQIDLSWDAYSGALGYDIERDSVIVAYNVGTNSYSDVDLDPSTQYTYRVRAVV
jgi:hypothetical protein